MTTRNQSLFGFACLAIWLFQSACTTAAGKFKPDEMKADQAAFFGHIRIFNHEKDITSKCNAEFTDTNRKRKVLISLDSTGWVFASVSPGDTSLWRIYCNIFSIPAAPINVSFDDVKFPVPGNGQITYFGDLTFRFNRVHGSLFGALVGDYGGYGQLPGHERLLTVKDLFKSASEQYDDRYSDQNRALKPVDTTTPWPVTVSCQTFHKVIHFALKNHYLVSKITPEIRDKTFEIFMKMVDPRGTFFGSTDRDMIRKAITAQLEDEKSCKALAGVRSVYVRKVTDAVIQAPVIDAVKNIQQEPFNALVLRAFIRSLDACSNLFFDSSKGTLGSQKSLLLPATQPPQSSFKELTLEESAKPVKVGVIRLGRFDPGTAKIIVGYLDQAVADGVSGIILDLSKSPGGLFSEVRAISSLFVTYAPLYTLKSRAKKPKQVMSVGDQVVYSGPLAVLISGKTGSGAETVAGSLRDLNRALLIGSRSFGNGGVDTQVSIGSGRILSLTFAMTFLPSGRSPEKVGIDPDVSIGLNAHSVSHPQYPAYSDLIPAQEPIQAFVPEQMRTPLLTMEEIKELQMKSDHRLRGKDRPSLEQAAAAVVADWVSISK